MSPEKDGGPAFPVQDDKMLNGSYGMSLRDYFAAKAMEGFNSDMVRYDWQPEVAAMAARHAYKLADAMLAERERTARP